LAAAIRESRLSLGFLPTKCPHRYLCGVFEHFNSEVEARGVPGQRNLTVRRRLELAAHPRVAQDLG
jgi:hypothetical protein